VLASRQGHCLADLLVRDALGELPGEIVLVASNHDTHAALAARFDVEFRHLAVGDDRDAQERALSALLDTTAPDVVVLARYMRVLPAWFVNGWERRMINIHHSFLPSFAGARPYAQAHERGVKVIGATAHYVTHDLDEGPIIEQIVERVDHGYTPEMLVAAGRDSERRALSTAVRYASEHRVFLNGGRTVVFK
jgi:formyltetrahydrofolate deformylase